MAFHSIRRTKPRLSPELDDRDLRKLLDYLVSTTRSGPTGMTDWCTAQISQLLERDPTDWDRRAHRVGVLAELLTGWRLPHSWVTRDPHNSNALVLYAWSEVARARSEGSLKDSAGVIAHCLRAAELAPGDPTPWVVVLSVARLERWPQPQVFGVWNEVLARDRWNREAYLNMLRYLSPKEAGSHLQVMEFVDALRARMPANAPCAATELTAQVFQYHSVLGRGGLEAMVARRHWDQATAAQTLDRAARTWLQPGFLRHARTLADLNLLAYALTVTGRRHEAHAAFEALRGVVTPWPWQAGGDPLDEFDRAQRRAGRGR